ncbi:MAG: hypothetical protein L0Y71_12875 [Gemmataceae bacterium]|nr:hypothetical protein [Gemmataceae bacterium]
MSLVVAVPKAEGLAVTLEYAYAYYGTDECVCGGSYNTSGAPTGYTYINPVIAVKLQMGENVIDSKNKSSLGETTWFNFSQPISPYGTYAVRAFLTVDSFDMNKMMVVGQVEKQSDSINVTFPSE